MSKAPPFIQKSKFPPSTEEISSFAINGEDFFEFFNKKSLKLILAIISGIVGVISNYYAVRHQITQTRFDMLGYVNVADFYALGVTAFLDLAIILFHLMRIPLLTWISTSSAILISLYANMNLIIQGHSLKKITIAGIIDLSYGGFIIVSLTMAILPIIILTYLMNLVMIQYADEKAKLQDKVI